VSRLAIALVHHPVLDAKGEVVASTLTSIDVHDLSRSARTYGCTDFFMVHPIEAQRTLCARIVEHWTTGASAKRIPDRKDALALVRIVETIEDAKRALGSPRVWVTAAREVGTSLSWRDARASLERDDGDGGDDRPVLVLFGTSWGLAPEVVAAADAVLAPIVGAGDWNHLSVRAACAIALDRLRGGC
jgi:hypothetical protein